MFTKYRKSEFNEPYSPSFTVPDQSFTPRQIIEQFASGELVVQHNQATDDYYDDKYSDDDLADMVVDVNDEFAARQHVIDFQISQHETQTANNVRESSDQRAAKTDDGVRGPVRVEGDQGSSSEGVVDS